MCMWKIAQKESFFNILCSKNCLSLENSWFLIHDTFVTFQEWLLFGAFWLTHYFVSFRLWTSLRRLAISTSPIQPLTLTCSPWMSQLCVNSRATWKPRPHDTRMLLGRDFFFKKCERGLQTNWGKRERYWKQHINAQEMNKNKTNKQKKTLYCNTYKQTKGPGA